MAKTPMIVFAKLILRTWRLWDVLLNPESHPVFRRVIQLHRIQDNESSFSALQQFLKIVLSFGIIYAVIYDVRLLLFIVILPIFFIMSIFAIPLLLPLVIGAYSTYLAMRISQIISREKAGHTYDLISMSPKGRLFANWHIASGVLYGNDAFEWLHMLVTATLKVLIVIIVSLFAFMLVFYRSSLGFLLDVRTLIQSLAIIGIFYSGYLQSIVLAVLVGIHIPLFDISEREGWFFTMLTYLAFQIGTYLVAALLIVWLHPMLSGRSIWLDLLLFPIYFYIILMGRGAVIEWLWLYLLKRLNASEDDLQVTQ